MAKKMKPKIGRPTIYKEEYPERLLKYFKSATPTKMVTKQQIIGSKVVEVEEEVPNMMPTVEAFCCEIEISKETYYRWIKDYPKFSDAYKKAIVYRDKIFTENTFMGRYEKVFSIFYAKCNMGWREAKNEDDENKDINVYL